MRVWFKKIREYQKLTHADISGKVGVSRQYIGMIEAGVATPHPDTAKVIAEKMHFEEYDVDWTSFYSTEDTKK